MRHRQKEAANDRGDGQQAANGADRTPRDGKQPYASENEDYGGENIVSPRAEDKTKSGRPEMNR